MTNYFFPSLLSYRTKQTLPNEYSNYELIQRLMDYTICTERRTSKQTLAYGRLLWKLSKSLVYGKKSLDLYFGIRIVFQRFPFFSIKRLKKSILIFVKKIGIWRNHNFKVPKHIYIHLLHYRKDTNDTWESASMPDVYQTDPFSLLRRHFKQNRSMLKYGHRLKIST